MDITFPLSLICDACRRPFEAGETCVQCSECTAIPTFLCSTCFSLGAEFSDHLKTHKCRKGLLNNPSMTVTSEDEFCSKLTFNSLLRFLRVIGEFGFHWEKVSNEMPLFGRNKLFSYQSCEKILFNFLKQVLNKPATCKALPIFPRPPIPSDSGPANFNYLRNEFEYDYLPEAEVFFADAQIPKDENEAETLIAALHAYNSILKERNFRKQTLLDCGLITLKDFVPKKRKADEKEIYDRLKIFLRPSRAVDPSAPHGVLESLAAGLATEKRLREHLTRLNQLRRSGVTEEKAGGALLDYELKQREEARRKHYAFIHNGQISLQEGPGNASKNRKGSIWSLDQLFGAEALTAEDRAVCDKAGVAPQHFLAMKKTLDELRKSSPGLTLKEALAFVRDAVIGAVWRSQGKKNILASETRELKTMLVEHLWRAEEFIL